jgi:Transcriptional Coactivator p15 (PC4)
MSAEIIIAEWPKNGRETLRIRLDSYQGQAVICARAWYAGSDGTMKPGRGGLTISIRHLPALASALAKAVETANAAGFLTVHEP